MTISFNSSPLSPEPNEPISEKDKETLKKLSDLAPGQHVWIRKDLSASPSSFIGRMLFSIVKYFDSLKSYFYDVSYKESRSKLEELKGKIKPQDKDLSETYNKAAQNFNRVFNKKEPILEILQEPAKATKESPLSPLKEVKESIPPPNSPKTEPSIANAPSQNQPAAAPKPLDPAIKYNDTSTWPVIGTSQVINSETGKQEEMTIKAYKSKDDAFVFKAFVNNDEVGEASIQLLQIKNQTLQKDGTTKTAYGHNNSAESKVNYNEVDYGFDDVWTNPNYMKNMGANKIYLERIDSYSSHPYKFVGKKLFQSLLEFGIQNGCDGRILLDAVGSAHDFYKKMGMQVTGMSARYKEAQVHIKERSSELEKNLETTRQFRAFIPRIQNADETELPKVLNDLKKFLETHKNSLISYSCEKLLKNPTNPENKKSLQHKLQRGRDDGSYQMYLPRTAFNKQWTRDIQSSPIITKKLPGSIKPDAAHLPQHNFSTSTIADVISLIPYKNGQRDLEALKKRFPYENTAKLKEALNLYQVFEKSVSLLEKEITAAKTKDDLKPLLDRLSKDNPKIPPAQVQKYIDKKFGEKL